MPAILSQERMTGTGKWAFVISLLFVFSISSEYRLRLIGLLVHPYLVLLPIAFLFSSVRISSIPNRVLVPLGLFYFIFSLLCLRNDQPFSEIFKVSASALTFLFFATAVCSEKDFRWISWGFVVCAVTIGIRGFLISEEGDVSRLAGINALEGIGNKNAQSLFTLPGVFFGTILLVKSFETRKVTSIAILLICLFFIVTGIFLSANRSGWLGLFVIAISFLFILGIKFRTIFIIGTVMLFSYLAISNYASDIFEHKSQQTVEGYESDTGRRRLIIESLSVGFANPLFGVGYDELHRQMALRLDVVRFGRPIVDTHFLPGYLFGSSGIIVFCLFFIFLKRLTDKLDRFRYPPAMRARSMVIAFVVLFVIRSFFTREILYSPTFIGGLGLMYGYYLLKVRTSILFKNSLPKNA